jgi:hypothetical protein
VVIEMDDARIDVPIGFDVPEGWRAVDATRFGVAFALVRDGDRGGFTPNVTIGVARRDDVADIDAAAAESVRRLATIATEVSVVDRTDVGNDRAPGLAQVVRLRTGDGELVQSQVHLTIPLGDAPHDRLLVELACTCRPDQVPSVVPDFQRLVASFHIRTGQEEQR